MTCGGGCGGTQQVVDWPRPGRRGFFGCSPEGCATGKCDGRQKNEKSLDNRCAALVSREPRAPRAGQDGKPCMANGLRLMSLLSRARGAQVSRAARGSYAPFSRPACRARFGDWENHSRGRLCYKDAPCNIPKTTRKMVRFGANGAQRLLFWDCFLIGGASEERLLLHI